MPGKWSARNERSAGTSARARAVVEVKVTARTSSNIRPSPSGCEPTCQRRYTRSRFARMKAIACLVVVALFACKGKAKDEPKPTPVEPGSAASGSAVAVAADAAAAPAVDERCATPCRFLADTPLAEVGAKVKATCSSEWATAEKDCAQLDYYRNCVYATAGYTFKKKRYQAAFGSEPWYKARAD